MMTRAQWIGMDLVSQALMIASRPNVPEGLAEAIRAERLNACWQSLKELFRQVPPHLRNSPKIKRQRAELVRGVRELGDKPVEFWLDEQMAFGSPRDLLKPIVNRNI